MKKSTVLLSVLMVIFVSFTASATDLAGKTVNFKGNSHTQFGNYEVKELLPIEIKGEQIRTFEISYENAKKTVMVYLEPKKNCRDYVVRSKNLEVRYVCDKEAFGVDYLSLKQQKYDPNLNSMFLSEEEFAKQKQLSEGKLPVETALSLIASYFPDLLKSKNLLD